MLREEVERPGQRERGRLRAGPQILLHLIDHLLAIEFGEARIGLGRLEHLQQRLVAMVDDVGADHGLGDLAPNLHGLRRILVGDLRELAVHLLQANGFVVHHVGVGLDLAEDEMRVERHLAIEQRLAHHLGGERPGLLDHLDGLAGRGELRPARHLRVDRRHQIGEVLLEHPRMERALLRRADLLPERAVDGDHALAEDGTQPVEIFDVVVGIVDEHALRVRRLRKNHDAVILEVDGDHAAIFLAEPGENLHGVLLGQERGQLEPDALLFAEPVRWRIGDCHISHLRLCPLSLPSIVGAE